MSHRHSELGSNRIKFTCQLFQRFPFLTPMEILLLQLSIVVQAQRKNKYISTNCPDPFCKQRDAASQALVLWLESLKTWFFANQKGSLRTWIFFARLGTECHGAEVGMRLNQNGFASYSIKLPSYIQVTKCIQMLDVTRVQLWNSWNHSLFVSHCELCPLSWFRSQTPTTKSCRRLSRWESSSVRTEEA